MSVSGVVTAIRSPLTLTASAPDSHSRSMTCRRSAADTSRSPGAAPGGTGRVESRRLITTPGPCRATKPGGKARVGQLGVEGRDLRGVALPVLLDRLHLRAEVQDLGLELVLGGLQLLGRLAQWRQVGAVVLGARHERAQLRGDEEAQHEQRHAERVLPARDAPHAGDERAHG